MKAVVTGLLTGGVICLLGRCQPWLFPCADQLSVNDAWSTDDKKFINKKQIEDIVALEESSASSAINVSLHSESSLLLLTKSSMSSTKCEIGLGHEMYDDGTSDYVLLCMSLTSNNPIFSKNNLKIQPPDHTHYEIDLPTKQQCLAKGRLTDDDDDDRCILSKQIFQAMFETSAVPHESWIVYISIPDNQVHVSTMDQGSSPTLKILNPSTVTVETTRVKLRTGEDLVSTSNRRLRSQSTGRKDNSEELRDSTEADMHHRVLAPSKGRARAALIRITALDAACTYNGTQLWANTFSGDGSLKTQLSACSNNQIQFTPTLPVVIEISVPLNANGADRMSLVNAAYPLAVNIIRRSEPALYGNLQRLDDYADFLMFVVVGVSTRQRSTFFNFVEQILTTFDRILSLQGVD
jgi:hypothetical protein